MPNCTHLLVIVSLWLAPMIATAQAPAPPPPQIQIRANINGGMSRSVQLRGQLRRITVTQDGETIVIEDTADKNITIKRTRTVNGEKKSDTYQAPDLDTLKKNHPDAADLYRKHTQDVQNAAQLQAQIQLRLGNGGPFGGPATFTPRPGQGSRQLSSSSRGKTVEIEDQYGENIKVRITEKSDGAPKTREVEAKDLTELEARDAEAAGHYKRLTADN